MELNSPENPAEQFLFNPFPNDKFFYSSKLKKFADDNFKFDQNGEVLKTGRKHCWKRRNCLLQAISPFLTVFSKDFYCRHLKRGLVWETVRLTDNI